MPAVLITGGHGGIGLVAARHLAANGFNLVLAGRSHERMEAAATALRSDCSVRVSTVRLDTSLLSSTREAATTCRDKLDSGEIDSLQAILCNAGATFRGPPTYTEEGFELTFATNYLGHFLLVQLLLDRLADTGRVVFTASGTHDPDTADGKFIGPVVEPDAYMLAKTGLDGTPAIEGGPRYTTSKLCTVLLAYELDRRLRRSGSAIASIAYDPGAIAATSLLRDLPAPARALIGSRPVRWIMRRSGLTIGDLALSGASLAELAVSPDYVSGSGRYYQWKDGKLHQRQSSKLSYDQKRAETLWRDSKQLVGLSAEEEPDRLK